jgi:polyisoprenoid-binding protein YceI
VRIPGNREMPASEILHTISPSDDSTIAIEVVKTGLLRHRKHVLSFENFEGQLYYVADRVESSRVKLCVDSRSLVCRDPSLRRKKQEAVSRYAREQALAVARHPEIRFSSTQISAKRLRGFAVEGVLDLCNVTRTVKVNIVLTAMKDDRFQIDGDATLRLSDFGIKPPTTLLGLIGTKDQALVRLLLWAIPAPITT